MPLSPDEVARFGTWRDRLGDDPGHSRNPVATTNLVLLPWRSTILVPELPAEAPRADRYRALARAGVASRLGGIGYDMIPVTANETLAWGMSDAFSDVLGVVKYMDRLSAISASSAQEFSAFSSMLGAQGLTGPVVVAHLLPSEVPTVGPEVLEQARRELDLGSIPMVLVVGSHEPRKNHVSVLLAAERLWREGLVFQLLFIGGSGWRGERFEGLVNDLVAAGRPVQVVKRAGEDVLWAAYRLARFTVFPSLAEGFGLPVAESLASGTPVVTSNFGSMAEIGRGGGALMVDPRSPDDLAGALRSLLVDDELLAQLEVEAGSRPVTSWDDHARATWGHLTS
jgi:glycosyltransferase involved in cell wall biosynthesis